ncbi:putative Golgi membrane protein [Tothia fuscella]|uniref:Protein YIP n=1 Tax=Tothia fuscella TaxID=1048955 RepID=A0A9P4TVF3_9PEZI|nr:putative Golgi membrane protein [Tothia fuscella]
MAQYGYNQGPQPPYNTAQNLQFYPSSYAAQPVSGHSTPFQAYSGSAPQNAYDNAGFGGGFAQPGVSGRMGEQGGLRMGWLAAFGTEGYDGEPPLLEELGVNFSHIKLKTFTVLNPLARIDQHIMDDSDLAGPILFFILFGFFLLFSGKVHFGYIYGLAALGSVALHTILSLMSPPISPADQAAASAHQDPHSHGSRHFSSTLTITRSASVLGYCLLPLVITSLVGIAVPMDSLFGYVLTAGAIAWCTYSSSSMFCAVGRMTSTKLLVAYPLGLFYAGFGIMAIFSSRGSGALQAKTTGG